jgi:hypothetical protein
MWQSNLTLIRSPHLGITLSNLHLTGGAKPSGGGTGQASSNLRGSSTGEGSKEDGQDGAGQMYLRRMAGGEGSFLDSVTPVQEKEVRQPIKRDVAVCIVIRWLGR